MDLAATWDQPPGAAQRSIHILEDSRKRYFLFIWISLKAGRRGGGAREGEVEEGVQGTRGEEMWCEVYISVVLCGLKCITEV
jgi:hypothetical protein